MKNDEIAMNWDLTFYENSEEGQRLDFTTIQSALLRLIGDVMVCEFVCDSVGGCASCARSWRRGLGSRCAGRE